MNQPSIAIVGGGFTGLVAALRLAEGGGRVTVFESGSELGGLAACFQVHGEPLEKAYHHLFRTDVEILNLIQELGLGERLEWLESSMAIYRDGRLWPFMTPKDLLGFGACSLVGRIRLGLVAMLLKYKMKWQDLAPVPALDWMRRHCGESATSAVWEPLLKGKFSSFASQVSMAWLWARLHVRANSRESGAAREKLGYIHGGFIQIVDGLKSRLIDLGVRIELDTRVEAVDSSEHGVLVRRNGVIEQFDATLFTGSNNAFSRVLPNSSDLVEYRAALQNIDYLGAVCMIFETDQQLGDFYWVNVNEPDWPFLVLIRHTKLVSAARYAGREVYYLGAYVPHDDPRFQMSDDQLKAHWFEALTKMFPKFESVRIEKTHCFRFRDAQHVVDCSYADKILPHDGPFKGLYLANFAQIFPHDRGTNFAVREGEEIALRIARDLGLQSGNSAPA